MPWRSSSRSTIPRSTWSESASWPATSRSRPGSRTRSTPGSCAGADVPIYVGEAAPLKLPLITAQNVHGSDGMGDIGLALQGRTPDAGHAVDALLQASHDHAGELTLVTLGPLTNVARAVERDPSLPDRIPRTVIMGAVADHVGNVTPVAEYNMWADPHAVDVVLRSGLQLEFVGWDISRFYTGRRQRARRRAAVDRHAGGGVLHRHQCRGRPVLRDRDQARRLRPARPDHDGVRDRSVDRHRRRDACTWRSRPRATSRAGWW